MIKLNCERNQSGTVLFDLHMDQPARVGAVLQSGHLVLYVYLGFEDNEGQDPIMCLDTGDLRPGDKRSLSWDKPSDVPHTWCEAHGLDRALAALGEAVGPLEKAEALGNPHDYPPYYVHDCTSCIYLGHASETYNNLPVDLYICLATSAPELERFGSVIARFGPEGGYISYPGFLVSEFAAHRNPLTREALARARDRDLLPPYNAGSLTCAELLGLTTVGDSAFPIRVGPFKVLRIEVNLLTVERDDRSIFYVREYELAPVNANAANRLLVLSMEAS